MKLSKEKTPLIKHAIWNSMLVALITFKPVLEIRNFPSDAATLLPLFSKMAHHIQAPPTTGAMSLGVSVFVLPKEARPPLSLCDPEVNWTHLARPRPIQLWSFTWDKNISQEQGTLRTGGGKTHTHSHAHAHMQRTHSAVSESWANLFYIVFSQWSKTIEPWTRDQKCNFKALMGWMQCFIV